MHNAQNCVALNATKASAEANTPPQDFGRAIVLRRRRPVMPTLAVRGGTEHIRAGRQFDAGRSAASFALGSRKG